MCWKVKKQTGEPWVSCFCFQRSYLPTRVLLLLWRPQLPFLPLCLGRLLSGTPAPPASWLCSCLGPLDLWVCPGLALCSAKATVDLLTFFRSLLSVLLREDYSDLLSDCSPHPLCRLILFFLLSYLSPQREGKLPENRDFVLFTAMSSGLRTAPGIS